jgi:ABC-type oligopeptide transport system substrate-binding subunit
LSGEAGDLAGFRIHSAQEFTIELDEPVSFFPALLTFSAVSIIPEGSEQFSGTWQQGCVGTGPFRVAKYEAGRFLELEANKNYWRKGYPKSDGLIYEFGISPGEIAEGFRAGRFALASDLFPPDVEALRREPDLAAAYRETPRLSTYYIAFNIHRGPFSDRGFRQRVVGSIDAAAVVRRNLGRLALPAHGFIPPGLIGHNPKQTSRVSYPAPPSTGSPEALTELRAAVNPVFFREHSTLLNELSRAFREHNVKIEPANRSLAEFDEIRQAGSADLIVTRWIADYPDADTFVHLLHSQEGFIGRFCGTAEVDRLIERGRAETSALVRHTLYHEIEEIIASEVLVLPLFYEQAYRFARPELQGLSVSFWGQTVDYASLQIIS